MAQEKIGRCEICGLVDHQLIGGECPSCRAGKLHPSLKGCVRVERDEAGNPMIRLQPSAATWGR